MRIVAQLRRYQRPGTTDWVGAGTIAAHEPFIAPARCYADADGAAAAAHGNPSEDPTRSFGDHPFGLSNAVAVTWSTSAAERATYGPVRILLDGLAGDALAAKKNGRTGICIHGGPLRDGQLRATHGCLRVDDDTAIGLAQAIETELRAGRAVGYACEELSA
jgi:hypothetical protein